MTLAAAPRAFAPQGGKDHAAARYIFTDVPRINRAVFHPADDALLDYLTDDNDKIEPQWYMPVLPMILVNGADGIGTGASPERFPSLSTTH